MFNYTVKELLKDIYQIRDPQGVCISVVRGEKLSLVIDTGYGIGEIRKEVEKLISTPYMVINTHGHMDHSNGNFQFDEVYLNETDFELLKRHNNTSKRKESLERAKQLNLVPDGFNDEDYINQGYGNVKFIKIGTQIDLGNQTAIIVDLKGHTTGSIGILLKEDKVLFTGDTLIDNVWMFLKESTTLDVYFKTIDYALSLDFDYFITGHLMQAFPKSRILLYKQVAHDANIHNSNVQDFPGYGVDHTYQYQIKTDVGNIGICFQDPIYKK